MPRPMSVSDTVLVSAPPATVYAVVSDPTRTHRWSPEDRGARWGHRQEAVPGPDGATATRVTQTWTYDRRWPDAPAVVVDRVLTGSTFAASQQQDTATSLARLEQLVQA